MPLLTGEELAAVCRKDRAWSSRALNGLRDEKLIEGTWYNLEGYGAVRWRLTELGVNTLAGGWEKPVRELLRRWPLSAEWEQSLLRRVQTVAVCHRIALDASKLHGAGLRWRWERADVFDAFMGLQDGRTVGICRDGNGAERENDCKQNELGAYAPRPATGLGGDDHCSRTPRANEDCAAACRNKRKCGCGN